MSKTGKKQIEAFYAIQEKQSFDNILVSKEELHQIINESIKESKTKKEDCTINEILYNTSSYILGILFLNHRIPYLRIPHSINSPLNHSERVQLQQQLNAKFFKNTQGIHFNQNQNCSPTDVLFFICDTCPVFSSKLSFEELCKSIAYLFEELCYTFAYLFERNLTSEEKGYIVNMFKAHLGICNESFDFNKKEHIIDSSSSGLNNSYQRSLEQTYGQNGAPVLYNLFLDTFLPEVLISCIKRFFLSATNNTVTYYQLISDCLQLSNIDQHTQYIPREADIFRRHICNFIHNNNDEKQYYQKCRGPKQFLNQNTLSQYEKDIYELIYLLHSRRKLKSSSKDQEFSQEEIDILHAKLNKRLETKLQCNKKSIELTQNYNDYIKYIVNQEKLPKTKNMLETAQQLIDFHGIIDDYFNRTSENNWCIQTSIFYAPWDFMQTAAYVWHHIPKQEPPYSSLSIDELTKLYKSYCQQINLLDFPKTQLLLLENPLFFQAYIESPLWIEDLPHTINAVFEITSSTLREICSISNNAFSHSLEELSNLDILLKQQYTYTPPKEKATPEMLEAFFYLYLPPKTSGISSKSESESTENNNQ